MNNEEQQDDDLLHKQRHSLAHILAQAVQRTVDPNAKLWIWPSIDVWFYYDFIFSAGVEFKEEHLKDLSKYMQKIVKENQPFHRIETDHKQAKEIITMMGVAFKIELLDANPLFLKIFLKHVVFTEGKYRSNFSTTSILVKEVINLSVIHNSIVKIII